LLSTRETVVLETPAASAISEIVGRLGMDINRYRFRYRFH
jgi:hypothetical protein